MQNLTELIRTIPLNDEEDPEDIFASAPGFLFTDDLRVEHGDPGSTIIYKSKKYGDIELKTADPSGEDERQLFSHYLWNAGVLMAERISGLRMKDATEIERWRIEAQTVLELGAGVGLAGIVASLSEAREVVISDYPAKVILENITKNVDRNLSEKQVTSPVVQGHEWGVFNDNFSATHKQRFTRVLAADCYWMPQVHLELVQSMLHFLSVEPEARVLAIAGFHTGRAKLASFFQVAVDNGLEIESIVEEDAQGQRRPWAEERDGGLEHPTERRKWLVIAVLRRGRP